jgi:hypothetical protein
LDQVHWKAEHRLYNITFKHPVALKNTENNLSLFPSLMQLYLCGIPMTLSHLIH